MLLSTQIDLSRVNSRIQTRQKPRISNGNSQIIKKDYNYFKGNVNLWDRPSIMSKKMYSFYHAYNEKNGAIENQQKNLQEQDRFSRQASKQHFVINFRDQMKKNFKIRKLERKTLQYESSQQLDVSLDDKELELIVNDEQLCKKIINKASFKVNFSNRANNLWNNMTNQPQKYINQVKLFLQNKFVQIVTPLILKQDERAVESLNEQFNKQQQASKVQGKAAIEKHEEQRQSFKLRHLQNYLYEKQLAYQKKIPFNQTWQKKDVVVNEKELEKMIDPEYFPCRYQKSSVILQKTKRLTTTQSQDYLNKLSKPREPFYPQAFLNQHSDYKGLLIGELDLRKASQTDNCFIRTILPSTIVQKALKQQLQNIQTAYRPKTGLTDLNLKTKSMYYKLKDLVIPTKNLDDFNQEHREEEKQVKLVNFYKKLKNILNEIEEFDKVCKKSKKGLGYTQSAFLDPPNLETFDGIKKIQEERMMRQMIQEEMKRQQFHSQTLKK